MAKKSAHYKSVQAVFLTDEELVMIKQALDMLLDDQSAEDNLGVLHGPLQRLRGELSE